MVEPTITSTKTPANGGKAAPHAAKPRMAKPRAAKSEAAARAAAGRTQATVPVAPEERRRMISERAYLRAERRGFQGGDTVEDWLAAEAEVDGLAHESEG